MDNKRKSDDSSSYSVIALISQVGFYIAVPPVAGGFLGRYLDVSVLHDSTPFATILGLLLGLAVGVYLVVRAVLRLPS